MELTRHVRAEGALTWLHARGASGLALPLRPEWQGHVRAAAHSRAVGEWLDDVSVFAELVHLGGNFVDPANLVWIAERSWLSVGARVVALDGALQVAVTVRDLLDRRGDDLLGFPLPGRRVFADLTFRWDER